MQMLSTMTIAAFLFVGGDAEAIRKDRAALQGTWKVVGSEQDGEKVPAKEIQNLFLIFKDDTIHIREGGKTSERFRYLIDPTRKIKEIDLTIQEGAQKGRTDRAIYRIEGNVLTICIQSNKDAPRPREFATRERSNLWLVILERTKE